MLNLFRRVKILLEVSNVNAGYGSIDVLRDVSISLGKNERVAIIGPNAAGKTTMFKTIMGILKPKAGEITFEGKRIDGLSANKILEMGIALVPEGRMIFPDMNVSDNLELGAYIHGGAKNTQDILEWVYQLFPILAERKDQLGGSLSGGEQQMLAIGRALMSKPRVLLLDEPSQGLAPIIVKTVFDAMEEIRKKGTSILVSEQNVRLALDFCDRGYILENGKVVLQDQACDLITNEHVREAYLGI